MKFFILVVIDVFSKYAWAEPLKTKTPAAVIKAFKKIFSRTERRPLSLQTDKGREYNNKLFIKFLDKEGIAYNTTSNPDIKASIAERFNRTILTKLYKYFTFAKTIKYLNVLDKILISYNNSVHRTTKYKPADVNSSNILKVYRNINKSRKKLLPSKAKFKVDDYVRISKYKNIFEKSYKCNFSDEIFKVVKVIFRLPVVFRICDLAGEIIEGVFYEKELQKVIISENTIYAIDKIIKRKRVGNSVKLFVKWRGYPDKFNSWIDSTVLENE